MHKWVMAEKRIKTIHDLGSSVQRLEVSAHDTDVLSSPQLLELLAGRTPVAGKVVNGANRHFSIACSLIGKMGAPFPGSSGLMLPSARTDEGLTIKISR